MLCCYNLQENSSQVINCHSRPPQLAYSLARHFSRKQPKPRLKLLKFDTLLLSLSPVCCCSHDKLVQG
jgi:hypothetical protein